MYHRIKEQYFEWLLKIIKPVKGYRKLLWQLFNIDFMSIIPMDDNRINDGNYLKHEFIKERGYQASYLDYISEYQCSILEMMIALSRRIETDIMADPNLGNQTSRWFWEMINNLGLNSQIDDNYNQDYVSYVAKRFMTRKYEPNGYGSLFILNNGLDNRNVEIWYQANSYVIPILRERGII